LYIEQDNFRREIIKVSKDEDFKTKRDSLTKKAILNLLNFGNNLFKYIILDGIFSSDSYSDMFNEINNIFLNVYAYYFNIPFNETVLRHKTRKQSNEFGEEEMKKWYKENDLINEIKEKIITVSQTKDEIITMILKDISIN